MLLIRCSQYELHLIKQRALQERRSVNAHILNILDRAAAFEEHLTTRTERGSQVRVATGYLRPPGPRAVITLRCHQEEEMAIRAAAARRGIAINEYVLSRLIRAYQIRDNLG